MSKPDKWIEFYTPIIGQASAESLVKRCQAGPPRNTAKLMLHQTTRLVTLADDIVELRPGRESLQLLFVLICAEHLAKLADGFESEGKSRFYVKEFFRQFADDDDKGMLDHAFSTYSLQSLGWESAIDALYGVRCDVVHEGNYWDFNFRDKDTSMLNQDPDLIARISFSEFRDLVVRCATRAVERAIN